MREKQFLLAAFQKKFKRNAEKTKGLIASNEALLLAKLEEAAKLASPEDKKIGSQDPSFAQRQSIRSQELSSARRQRVRISKS